MICVKEVRKIHLIGICGTAMGNIAVGLKQLGYSVTGSDSGIYPPMSDFLKENRIEIKPYSENNVKSADAVIIGNAIPRGNVEAEYVLNNKIPFLSLPEAINAFFAKDKKIVLITGTHGKTTTSSLIAYILEQNEFNPSFLIGGIIPQLKTGFKYSEQSEYFVIEGDEYDTAFFDKTSKFLKFTPDYLTVNCIEFDHGDIFNNIEEIKKSFVHLLKKCPSKAMVFLNRDDKNTIELENFSFSKTSTFGFDNKSDVKIDSLRIKNGFSIIGLNSNGKYYEIKSFLHGEHNARNIAAAFSVCIALGIEPEKISESISTFKGVARRFEKMFSNSKNAVIINDFAHHPTAIKYAIKTAKEVYPERKIIAIIEPGTNTVRSGFFNKELSEIPKITDYCIFLPLPKKKKQGASDRFSPPRSSNSLTIKSLNDFREKLETLPEENCVYLFMSNASPWDYIKETENYLKDK